MAGPFSNQSPSVEHQEPLEHLADLFAAQAVKTVLAPTPDGLEVFEELTRASRKSPPKF